MGFAFNCDLLHKNKYRVKPGPDPLNGMATKWMTTEQMDIEILKESKEWIEAGSGGLGKLYFEVLSCDGLPNMDAIPLTNGYRNPLKGKTDAFACIIFEDCIVNTDVINDTCSPRWLPWTQRAFVFNISHAATQVHLSIFDFDHSTSHDFIGKVTIDITNSNPKTNYLLKYNLYQSNYVSKGRMAQGTITIRARIEWTNERKILLDSIHAVPQTSVNVSNVKDYLVASQTIVGEVSQKTLKACHTVLFSIYVNLICHVVTILGYLARSMMCIPTI